MIYLNHQTMLIRMGETLSNYNDITNEDEASVGISAIDEIPVEQLVYKLTVNHEVQTTMQ